MSTGGERLVALLAELVSDGRIHELSHPLTQDMPVFPFHVPYSLALHRRHGDTVRPGESSFANDIMVMSTHSATHVDAIGHFSRAGRLHGGGSAAQAQSDQGLSVLDAASVPPVFARGVLLDIPRVRGVSCLAPGDPVGAGDLERAYELAGTPPRASDVVLVRTGWASKWGEPAVFNGHAGGYPGVDPEGAAWLLRHDPQAVGADTPAFEVSPPAGDSVHAMVLTDAGVYIVENLDLEGLAGEQEYEFLFVMLSLRIQGGTGSPVRAVALT